MALLGPHMQSYFNSLAKGGHIPLEGLLAHISVFIKDSKDLLNVDRKVLAKIWANLLQDYMHKIIHKDQLGFISSR